MSSITHLWKRLVLQLSFLPISFATTCLGIQFTLYPRFDPLKYMLSKLALTSRLAKWVMLLSEFNIQYVDRKAIKGRAIQDHLIDAPLINAYPLVIEFFDEHIYMIKEKPSWKLYFDGSYTSHGSEVGILLVTPQGDYIPKAFKL